MRLLIACLAMTVVASSASAAMVAPTSNTADYVRVHNLIEARIHVEDLGLITAVQVEFWYAGAIYLGSAGNAAPSGSPIPLYFDIGGGITHVVAPHAFETWADVANNRGVIYFWTPF